MTDMRRNALRLLRPWPWFAFEEHLNWMALASMVIGVTGVALVLRRPDLPATKI